MKKPFLFIFFCFVLPISMHAKNYYVSKNVAHLHVMSNEFSEVGSQAIYGTPLQVLQKNDFCFFVETPDKYHGWILKENVIEKHRTYLKTPIIAKVQSLWAHIHLVDDTTPFPPIISLPFDTKIEVISEKEELEDRWIMVRLIDGQLAYAQSQDFTFDSKLLTVDEMITLSKKFIGIPYFWGGASSFGFDCSGFTQMLYKQMGINISKDSFSQAIDSNLIDIPLEEIKKGDLLFFSSNGIRVTHVGMYLKNDDFIHASTKNVQPVVQISKLSSKTPNQNNITNFVKARRPILKESNMSAVERTSLPPIPIIDQAPSGEIIIGDFVGKWWNPLPVQIQELIVGKSFKEGAVDLKDLAYVQITHINADGEILQGELVYHVKLAREITEIFLDLFKAEYPIEKVRLIDHYDANDDLSMADNCSSALCVRNITGSSTRFSKHSYGGTIDINPLVNPYVKGDTVLPPESAAYLDRTREGVPGLIKEGDVCYRAFVDRGYTWGGHWTSLKDYQHFEKDSSLFCE
jgi:gamma-D-glutamyl-L-lysine dipeptidyl-peptidase